MVEKNKKLNSVKILAFLLLILVVSGCASVMPPLPGEHHEVVLIRGDRNLARCTEFPAEPSPHGVLTLAESVRAIKDTDSQVFCQVGQTALQWW